MPAIFGAYELRTKDPDAARRFYADVLGETPANVSQLPERAAARGAPAHWLGWIDVADAGEIARRMIALGGEPLGPMQPDRVIMRDPVGSIVAVRSASGASSATAVAWHQLNTVDHERAWAVYAELFGWHRLESWASELGPWLTFAWSTGGPAVGGMVDSARLPHIHTHWLFFFPVPDLDAALAKVRAAGGTVLEPIALHGGPRVAPCEDPQGAMFGLLESS